MFGVDVLADVSVLPSPVLPRELAEAVAASMFTLLLDIHSNELLSEFHSDTLLSDLEMFVAFVERAPRVCCCLVGRDDDAPPDSNSIVATWRGGT